jgi:hypothetical protein
MDSIVYDMSSQSETDPNIFIKKDWVTILDNQNSIYSSNQSVIDTSQFSNSNKWINYREAYFTVPMLLTLTQTAGSNKFLPNTATTSCDYALGLKNWYGSIIHSFSVDLAGTTIIQQTPFQSLWNTFRLLTTLSYQDLLTIGPSIGLYIDNSSSWSYNNAAGPHGSIGVSNSINNVVNPVVSASLNALETTNNGFYQRQRAWNFNSLGTAGTGRVFNALVSQSNLQTIYKSSILPPVDGTDGALRGYWAAQIVGTVFLRHLHSFFSQIPLVKGMFMKMTLNLNNSITQVTVVQSAATGAASVPTSMTQLLANSSFPLGGVNPLMFASGNLLSGMSAVIVPGATVTLEASLTVGSRSFATNFANVTQGYVNSLTLSAPCYTFNPAFEGAYLANAVRKIDYEDIYQYQILNQVAGSNINSLVSNGIAGIKSVLVIPFHSPVASVNNSISPIQSCFDPAGGGPTSPLSYLSNYNVVISGQNAVYNSQRYTYEAFLNQLNGQNSINGNQVDGLGSGLISQMDFENCYNHYYVNVERCLPIEKGVSKSVSIVGQNVSALALDLYVFVCYGVSVSINVLLGSRV